MKLMATKYSKVPTSRCNFLLHLFAFIVENKSICTAPKYVKRYEDKITHVNVKPNTIIELISESKMQS